MSDGRVGGSLEWAADGSDRVRKSTWRLGRAMAERPFEREFEDLFERHHAKLFRFLNRSCGDPETAKDIVQETFVRLYRRRSCPDSPEAWLISVALNLLRNFVGTQTRRRKILERDAAVATTEGRPPTPAQVSEGRELQTRVRGALGALSERDRSILLLHGEGYPYRDIADALGVKSSSIGTLLARAKRAFRSEWERRYDAHR